MKKNLLIFISLFISICSFSAVPQINIEGTNYRYDTIEHVKVGPGTYYTKVHIPEYKTGTTTMGLYCHYLVADLTNPYLKYEVVLSHDSILTLERPSAMASRKSYAGHNLFAGTNGDFYDTGSQQGLSINGSMVQGEISRSFPTTTRPLFGISANKKPFIDVMQYNGKLTIGSQDIVIDNINSTRSDNQLIFFNSFKGKNTGTNQFGTEVIVRLKEGNTWGINNTVQCVVEEVRKNMSATLIPKGKAVLSAHGTKATLINALQVGDEVSVRLNVNLPNSTNKNPFLTDVVGGDRWILKDGTYYGGNWADRHPRTCLGFSQDSTKIIQLVVDGRWDASNGATTYQCADIIKLAGAYYAFNLDGGGSSAMIVKGAAANKTSDGNERAVSNGIFAVSTAPTGSCSSIDLLPNKLDVQFGQKVKFNVIQYNEYGDVHDWKTNANVNFYVNGNIGSISSTGEFTANGTGGTAWVVAEINGAKDSTFVSMRDIARISVRQKYLVVDNLNPYLYKVSAFDAANTETTMPNNLLQWTCLDENIGGISSEGVFTGFSNGETKVIARFNENIIDTVDVSVEIGENKALIDNFSDATSWTWKQSEGYLDNVTLKNVSLDGQDMLEVVYTFTYKNRTAFVLLEKDIRVYGMPDSVEMIAKFPKNRYSLFYTTQISGAGMFTDPFTHDGSVKNFNSVFADLSQDQYPARLKTLRLQIERIAAYKLNTVYTDTIYLKSLSAIYPTKTNVGWIDVHARNTELKIAPNPVRNTARVFATNLDPNTEVEFNVFNVTGQKVTNSQRMPVSGNGILDINLNTTNFKSGFYICKIMTNKGELSTVFIVKKDN